MCFCHTDKIKQALGIGGVHTEISPWRQGEAKERKQIDLVIDRDDRIINLCELKFATTPYTITRAYDQELQQKVVSFVESTHTRKTPQLTMITTYGLAANEYSGHIQRSITIDRLFVK